MSTTRNRLFKALGAVAAAALLGACGGGASKTNAKAVAADEPTKAALAIQADIVQGPKNLAPQDLPTGSCVLQSRFARNGQVVWRARVLDAASGKQLDDTQVDTIVVKLGDGQSFPMKYGQHPKTNPTDAFWATSWTVPADYPTGSVSYSIEARDKAGATVTFEPFNVAPSLLTITDKVLTAAAPGK